MAAVTKERDVLHVSELPTYEFAIKANAMIGKREQLSEILQQDNIAAK